MNKETFLGAKTGIITGVTSVIVYALINTTFNTLSNIIFWHAPVSYIPEGLKVDFINHSFFLLIPFTIICLITGIVFSIIIATNHNLNEKTVAAICTFICLMIALTLYFITKDMIYNINAETMFIANLEFRTIPYTLFVVWGYFVSRIIYRNAKQLSNGKSTSS